MLRAFGAKRTVQGRLAVHKRRTNAVQTRWSASVKQRTVEIGGVVAPINDAKSGELVPHGYLPALESRQMSQELLGHLRWMIQKDLLKQDMFLIGPPGASRRLLAMRFCELLNKEVEYISVSQDTTESDLKQRREIVNGAAIFTDQAPVRAAIHGRVLVIDGLEKAERNVLPTLNNLLENREMTLDDGRFLMKAESFDALLSAGYSKKDLTEQNLVRVHPDFRVIALGLPVPPYPGRTLDPPLRSRFQARNVQPSSPGTQLENLVCMAPKVPISTLERIISVREAVNAIESMHDGLSGQRMPHFDYLSLSHCAKVLALFPHADLPSTVRRVFPVTKQALGAKAAGNCDTVDRILKKFASGLPEGTYKLADITKTSPDVAHVKFASSRNSEDLVAIDVPCGISTPKAGPMPGFVETETHGKVLMEMLQDHAVGSDLCILGEKGSGKSDVARLFAHRLGYATELFSLFKDMTARDLLQRRSTDSHGNTFWEDSPLIHAARHGHVAVLDGVHRLGSDSLGVLQRLVQDREIDLADGSKLLHQAKYDEILREAKNKDPSISTLSRVHPIHPAFRVIAIAETDPVTSSGATVAGREPASAWLQSDSIAMFTFHHLPKMSQQQMKEIVHKLYPQLPRETTELLLSFSARLDKAKEGGVDNEYMSLNLSLRQVLRLCRRLNAFPEQSLRDFRPLMHDTLLTQFLPSSCARLVNSLLDECGSPQVAVPSAQKTKAPADTIREENGRLVIGNVSHPIQTPQNPELVPQPHYFDIPKHTKTMKEMLQDVVAGQKHMLLIGNQGVGKNKLADRLLQLLQQEREYIQLHRDTTVQTLTLVPTLIDGKIVWEDSPLVRAAKTGRTLVVDEADKAPLEVVCVLKGLIEDGEMLLGNGKRLIDPTKVTVEAWHDKEKVILLHPDFRMWVLANRPGFPFLGNNFFREIGDVFASHAIDNPDEESELALLKAYAPSVSVDILRRICNAFAELRELVENGTITYPYSTREAVAVAKHLELFPNDGVTTVLENVLAFDAYDRNLRKQLSEVFLSHGIPLSANGEELPMGIALATPKSLPAMKMSERWQWDSSKNVQISMKGNKQNPHACQVPLQRREIWLEPATTRTFSLQQHRLQYFTEQLASFKVPLNSNRKQKAHAITCLPDDSLHVLTTSPMILHSFTDVNSPERTHKVQEIENQYMQWEHNPVLVHLSERHELAVFLPSSGLTVILNPSKGSDGRVHCTTLPDGALAGHIHPKGGNTQRKKAPFSRWFGHSFGSDEWKQVSDTSNEGILARYLLGGSVLQLVDLSNSRFFSFDLGAHGIDDIVNVQSMGENEWMIQTTNGAAVHALQRTSTDEFLLRTATIAAIASQDTIASTRHSLLPHGNKDPKSAVMVHPEAYLQQLVGDSSDVVVRSALRESEGERWGMNGAWSMNNGDYVVNTKADDKVVDLEVTFPKLNSTKTIRVNGVDEDNMDGKSARRSRHHDPAASLPRVVGAVELNQGRQIVTLEEQGDVRLWQLDDQDIAREVALWKQMFGVHDESKRSKPLSLKVDGRESVPRTGLDEPKHGKEDPNNDPHVGGNTWAGGTGGSDTAGLGGRGGPYRLDKGHPVHQISQEKKDEVSAEARAKARAMAEEALASRLNEIDMSDKEWATYQRYFSRVEHESSQLRSILENLESFAHERSWLRHQSSGELDDTKLVDGVTGERMVFKRRGVSESPFQTLNQTKPKRMLFVMDVSGSMYRFNGQDGRLERVLETSLMIMESFAGFENKFEYAIMGHSGDSPEIPFVEFGEPPQDRKERLKVLQKMVAHSQYCMSGDHTVEAIQRSIERVVDSDAEDYFVFVVSDANLERYNISPKKLGRQLVVNPRVKANVIFIASFANEADRILRELPAGRGHVCLDTTDLPRLFKKMFTTAFGNN
ncbi:TPA: hypothetical protein N0F65_001311 [Lagenidium giganteum]|uniref:VWFA domain-containing protein n=1 Tax=Lagenidium giganteum TaxID=4803 RepID=A0AAV2YXK3_9STRA|nr:TPA: hypothetical protein N0F65_001311 [Lagenidium giganteum]